jgi:nitrite reductase/ring-hydroxylating ferredoxin subunit/uncharacterized membrane protein
MARVVMSVSERLENAPLLQSIGGPLNTLVHGVLRPGRVRDLLSGTAIGHPAHPAIISAPIGCWTGAFVADLCGERDAARTLTAAGVISALPTAATGLSDWADTAGAEQRVGVVHLAANLAATAFYAASWRARAAGRHGLGVGLGLVGATLATAGGWLGGHLAYSLGVGVDTNAFAGGPTDWTPVTGRVTEPSGLSSGSVDGIGVVIVPGGSSIPAVLANRCSHRGGPLAEGEVVGSCIRCPWHHSEFDLARGSVRRGPATEPQPVYEVRPGAGGLEVRRHEERALRVNSARPR